MSRQGSAVLIMAGGTGGHIFPGLAVAECLVQQGISVRWLGASGGMECQRVPAAGISLDTVEISGIRGKGMARWLVFPWHLLRAVAQAFALLGAERPACAVSFGGYAAGPGGLAAKLRGVPLLVHEQNRIPGMTNRVLAKMADKVLQAFPGTWEEKLQACSVGNPVRTSVASLKPPESRLAGRSGALRLLVTGGSQGARALNRFVPSAVALISTERRPEVLHQCGKGWSDETRANYQTAGVQAEVTEFIDDMAAAYAWADLVVCRSGALTVSELAAAGIGAILVPFPHAVDDHQSKNAEFLVQAGAAELLPEVDCSAESLASCLDRLLADRGLLLEMASASRSVAIADSAQRVAQLCREYLPS